MPNGLNAGVNPGMVPTNIQSHGPCSMLRYALLFVLAAISPALAQPVTDYLKVPGPIALGDTSYELAWSAQPAPDYTKQEYVPAGQSVDNFESMVIVEFLVGDATPASIAQSQIAMLEERKASDPLVNMDLLVNDASGEIILDFVVSAADANGDIIVEWNAYRYASATTSDGQSGGLLFAVSHRAYGDADAKTFLAGLATLRSEQIDRIAAAPLPAL